MALAGNLARWLPSAYRAWWTTATAADDWKPLQLSHRKPICTRPPSTDLSVLPNDHSIESNRLQRRVGQSRSDVILAANGCRQDAGTPMVRAQRSGGRCQPSAPW